MNMTLILAALAATSVLLIMFALVGRRGADPVQARLSQLGTMQAKTLEELELQQPFFDRSIRPLALKLSGIGQKLHEPQEGPGHREAAGHGRQPLRDAHGRLPGPQGGRGGRHGGRRVPARRPHRPQPRAWA